MPEPVRRALVRACVLAISAAALLGPAPAASAHGGAHSGISHRDQLPPAPAHGARKARAASAPGAGLPAAWCGSRTTRDQDINSPSPEAAAIKLVYAYPADRPDRSGQIARMLQASAREIGLYIAAESGGRKSVRFDLGTRCGPRYLDIATVPLSQPRSSYLAGSRVGAYQIRDEVSRSVGRGDGPRNYLVYVDNLLPSASYGEAEGIFTGGDEPGADNPHNAGDLYGFVWSEDGASLDLSDTTHLLLHELSHTLGAVQESAPHSTGFGHCRDAIDIMCYDDGGARGAVFTACEPREGLIPEHFDCNNDDYFDPTPTPGSYVAKHWNVYESRFLGACRELATECASPVPAVKKSKKRAARLRARRAARRR